MYMCYNLFYILFLLQSIIVEDGSPSTLIATTVSIDNGVQMLQGMTITLSNIVHAGEEYLSVDEMIATELGITLVKFCWQISHTNIMHLSL